MENPRLRRHELGFLEVIEKPSPEALAEYYENNYYQNEAASYRKVYSQLENDVIKMRVAQRAAEVFAVTDMESIGSMLDVGCGEGFVISHFLSLGWHVEGIDYSSAGVDQINPHCSAFVQQGDIFRILYSKITSGDKYDLVWLGNVLEHVLDPIGLLRSLKQIVNDKGLLVVTVPNDGNAFHENLLKRGDIQKPFWIAIPDHLSYFTAESLKRTVSATGWSCRAIHGDFPIDWYLAHEGSNYVTNPALGAAAHRARLELEYQIGTAGIDAANRFYASLAEVGLGRNITVYLSLETERFPT